jgi:hypothetical protein
MLVSQNFAYRWRQQIRLLRVILQKISHRAASCA